MKKKMRSVIIPLMFMALVFASWRIAPVEFKNLFLSNICDDFYAPTFQGEFKLAEKDYSREITFRPHYYGPYTFEAVMNGNMGDFGDFPREIGGMLHVEILCDGVPIEYESRQKWRGGIGYNDGKIFVSMFTFSVNPEVEEVRIKVTVAEPFIYFRNHKSLYAIVRNSYSM